ncbi:inorganic phosphate transporter [Klebsiella pneumoniae]|nr:inorganic phosphate transporter [Klebsiella pneumoniae]
MATVIYTRAMRSQLAVAMAALFNFFGVLLGGLSVAYAIDAYAADRSAVTWVPHMASPWCSLCCWRRSSGTSAWYFGLPASSSHTLIGAIIGIGLTNALMTSTSVVDALEYPEVIGIFASLIIADRRSGDRGQPDFPAASLLERNQKNARIHRAPAERERKTVRKSRRSGPVSR